MVSGFGINPLLQRQIGFPDGLGVQVVPGPHGEGLQGFFGLGRGVLRFINVLKISSSAHLENTLVFLDSATLLKITVHIN